MSGVSLSIVTTLYYSQGTLPEFYRRVMRAAEEISDEVELILVNDGSPDQSLQAALELRRQDPRVRIVDLSRNFGHHKAMMTGLAYARGNLVYQQDCDLEEDPENLLRYLKEMREADVDVAYGVAERREGSLYHILTGWLFFVLFNFLADVSVAPNILTTRLMTRRYVDALLLHRDRKLFPAGVWLLAGFDQRAVPVRKRRKSTSTYNLVKKISIAVTGVTAFSEKPLVMIFVLGLFISAGSLLAALFLVFRVVFLGSGVDGWPSLIVSVWFLGGLTIASLGVIGIYLATIFAETKDRPYTVVRSVYEDAGWEDEVSHSPVPASHVRDRAPIGRGIG